MVPDDSHTGLGQSRASALTPFKFGLTPVLLDSGIALLAQMQLHLEEALGAAVEFVEHRTYLTEACCTDFGRAASERATELA